MQAERAAIEERLKSEGERWEQQREARRRAASSQGRELRPAHDSSPNRYRLSRCRIALALLLLCRAVLAGLVVMPATH
jgi:hypothetical protein